MKIAALAGGVGGARLANGLAQILNPGELTVIVNTGDDFVYTGLHICPDLDTVTYTLAGINDPINGWGLAHETWTVLTLLDKLGHPIWFKLGDRDLATHIERTRLLQLGFSLTEVVDSLSYHLGIKHKILPMTDDPVQTQINTEEFGLLSFQEYFVKHKFQPKVKNIEFSGITDAHLTESVKTCLEQSDLVLFCPSNPFVSINPILSIPGVRELVSKKTVVAVSPLINGKTIKGPASKMMVELGMQPSSLNIANYYGPLLTGFVLDYADHDDASPIRQCGIIPLESDILMNSLSSQARLAREVIKFGSNFL